MNPFSLNDPDLAALEAELLGQSPRLDPGAQQAILYKSAFQAGKAAASKTTRIWQAFTAGLGLMLVVTLFPWNRANLTPQGIPTSLPPAAIPSQLAATPQEELPLGTHGSQGQTEIAWETWKSAENKSERFDQELKKFTLLEPHEKAISLIQFSRLESLGY